MAWTTPRTWTAGETVTAAIMNTHVRDNLAVLAPAAVPSCRAYRSSIQEIANNTETAILFTAERWDTDTIHDNSTNTNRLTCKTAGIYGIYTNILWESNGSGRRRIAIKLNGTTYIAWDNREIDATGDFGQNVYTEYSLAVNDYVDVQVYQDSGGALDIQATGNYSCEFGMTYLGKAS